MSFIDKFLDAIKLNDDFDDDDDGEDFLEDEEEDSEEDHKRKKPEKKPVVKTEKKEKKRFFKRSESDDDDDDFDDAYDDEEAPARAGRTARSAREEKKVETDRKTASYAASSYSSRPGYSSYSASSATKYDGSADRTGRYAQAPSSRTAREWEKTGSGSVRSRKNPKSSSNKKKDVAENPMEVNVIRPSSMEDTMEIADTLMVNCTVVLNLEGLDVDIAQRVIDFTCGVCYSLDGNLQKISSYIFIITPADVDIAGDFQSILNGAFDIPSMNTSY